MGILCENIGYENEPFFKVQFQGHSTPIESKHSHRNKQT